MQKVLILANNSTGLYNFRAELLKQLILSGYEVYFSLPESKDDEKVKLLESLGAIHIKTDINRRGMNVFQEFRLIKEYKKIISNIRPDVILTYTIKPNVYGSNVSNKFNIPVIMNITGIGSSMISSNLKFLFKKMYKLATNKASIVYFQNEENKDFFLTNKLVDSNKVKLLPGSGVNINKFKEVKMDSNSKLIFTYIGRIMKEKGVEEFLEVAHKITNKYDNIQFHIVGFFEEKKYEVILKSLTNENIKYLGISNDVRKEISNSSCIINPSYHEGMSNVLLESAAMGKPLIASNISGCKEIIDDNKNGFLFEVKNSEDLLLKVEEFIKLSRDKKLLMGIESRKKVVSEFNRDIVVEEYLKTISGLIS